MNNVHSHISGMCEKSQYPYVFWQGLRLIITMPVTGGERIGTDNTCKTAYALRKFWGKESNSESKKDSVFHVLDRMQTDISNDCAFLQLSRNLGWPGFTEMSEEQTAKLTSDREQKLKEITRVKTQLHELSADDDIAQLSHCFPRIPSQMMAALDQSPNARRLLLAPHVQDTYTRLDK